eukprot:1177400-Prorocentrum_minimum.AAC.3
MELFVQQLVERQHFSLVPLYAHHLAPASVLAIYEVFLDLRKVAPPPPDCVAPSAPLPLRSEKAPA